MKWQLLALAVASCAPVHDRGGDFFAYVDRVKDANARHALLEVRGICDSGCAVKLSAKRVCVEENATVRVHEARVGPGATPYAELSRNEEATKMFHDALPPCAAKLFDARGGFSSGALVAAKGWEILDACPQMRACP